jgi:hypothetical protein
MSHFNELVPLVNLGYQLSCLGASHAVMAVEYYMLSLRGLECLLDQYFDLSLDPQDALGEGVRIAQGVVPTCESIMHGLHPPPSQDSFAGDSKWKSLARILDHSPRQFPHRYRANARYGVLEQMKTSPASGVSVLQTWSTITIMLSFVSSPIFNSSLEARLWRWRLRRASDAVLQDMGPDYCEMQPPDASSDTQSHLGGCYSAVDPVRRSPTHLPTHPKRGC